MIFELVQMLFDSVREPEPAPPVNPFAEIARRTAQQVQMPMAQRFYLEEVLADLLRERSRIDAELATARRLGRADLYNCYLTHARELDRDIAHQEARLDGALRQQAEAERWRGRMHFEARQLQREMEMDQDAELTARVNQLQVESQMVLNGARANASAHRRACQRAGAEARAFVASTAGGPRYQLERAAIDAEWQRLPE